MNSPLLTSITGAPVPSPLAKNRTLPSTACAVRSAVEEHANLERARLRVDRLEGGSGLWTGGQHVELRLGFVSSAVGEELEHGLVVAVHPVAGIEERRRVQVVELLGDRLGRRLGRLRRPPCGWGWPRSPPPWAWPGRTRTPACRGCRIRRCRRAGRPRPPTARSTPTATSRATTKMPTTMRGFFREGVAVCRPSAKSRRRLQTARGRANGFGVTVP